MWQQFIYLSIWSCTLITSIKKPQNLCLINYVKVELQRELRDKAFKKRENNNEHTLNTGKKLQPCKYFICILNRNHKCSSKGVGWWYIQWWVFMVVLSPSMMGANGPPALLAALTLLARPPGAAGAAGRIYEYWKGAWEGQGAGYDTQLAPWHAGGAGRHARSPRRCILCYPPSVSPHSQSLHTYRPSLNFLEQ